MGFRRGGEVPDDLDDARVQANVFGSASAGHHKSVVGRRLDGIEIGVSEKLWPRFSL